MSVCHCLLFSECREWDGASGAGDVHAFHKVLENTPIGCVTSLATLDVRMLVVLYNKTKQNLLFLEI